MALGPPHYLANMIDHRFLGERLNSTQKEQAFEFLNAINPDYISFVMSLTTKTRPFPKFLFGTQFRNTNPLTWWKSVTVPESEWPEKEKFLELCNQLLTSVAATAGLERFFSNFGIIQSKLRNRLGNEKASKLVFMFKYLNEDTRKKKANLDWIWQEQLEQMTEAVATSENSLDGNVSPSTIIE